MKVITSNDVLLRFVPNVFATVEGEKSLFEKIEQHLIAAEQWVEDSFISAKVMEIVTSDGDGDGDGNGDGDSNSSTAAVRNAVASCIVNEALLRAIPSLDLVLTPNGFGIVNNQNVAPASKERVERLLLSMEANRDKAIGQMLILLKKIPEWKDSAQFSFFHATMFPNFTVLYELGMREHLWTAYLDLRQKALFIEGGMAARFFSPEETAHWRTSENLNEVQVLAASQYQAIVIHMLRGNKCPEWACFDLIELIKMNPDSFPLWHNSNTALLFAPPVFRNERKSSGYWF